MVTYLTLRLALFPDEDYEEVAARVTGLLDGFGCRDASWSMPTASAITRARKRLGRGVFPELFERTCGPVAGDTAGGADRAGRRPWLVPAGLAPTGLVGLGRSPVSYNAGAGSIVR